MGNEHTQSIRAEQSGGRGKIGTKAGFWKEQELEWGVNRNRMGEGSPGTPARGRNPSLSQIDSKQTEQTVYTRPVLRPEGGVRCLGASSTID